MDWRRLISDVRLGLEEFHDPRRHTRSDFQRDYDRLIFSSPFRRMQNKTQVFPLPGSIFVHNRLTHSLEVSSVGRSMANEVAIGLMKRYGNREDMWGLTNIGDIVATACLSHDLGNPPFGHNGEKTISTFFSEGEGQKVRPLVTDLQWSDLTHFEGNANSFRLLTHRFEGRREGGFAMTYSSLAAVVKYPYGSPLAGEKGKFGFFESEEGIYRKVASTLGIPELEPGRFARHPLVWLVEAADDICYQVMDLEDSHRLKILSTEEVKHLLMQFFAPVRRDKMERMMARLHDPNEQIGYLRSNVIGAMVEDCARVFIEHEDGLLSGIESGSLIEKMEPRLSEAYSQCSVTAWEKIYRSPEVVDIEIAGNRILTYLLDNLTEAALHPERNFSRLMIEKVPSQYSMRAPDFFTRLQGVLDHVSGMTDVYALNLYRQLTGLTLPAV
ncbi:MAG: dNTP triphosphohydrolase [Muribaculaceae bacterium]|nr:dNTP triphosphohydrolase [Muribaculaceae bacterium]MDE6558883.1 dNTP triphosphohydrolase [Muribaculaceae bacterium]